MGKGTRSRERQTERDSNTQRDKDKQERERGRTRKTKKLFKEYIDPKTEAKQDFLISSFLFQGYWARPLIRHENSSVIDSTHPCGYFT